MRLIDADILRDEWLGAIGEYTANEILSSIDDIPTAEPPISAVEYLQIHDRFVEWCTNQPCSRCNYHHDSCLMSLAITPEQRVADMQKWAREHPEERSEE